MRMILGRGTFVLLYTLAALLYTLNHHVQLRRCTTDRLGRISWGLGDGV
jgi:hypothetical protein